MVSIIISQAAKGLHTDAGGRRAAVSTSIYAKVNMEALREVGASGPGRPPMMLTNVVDAYLAGRTVTGYALESAWVLSRVLPSDSTAWR